MQIKDISIIRRDFNLSNPSVIAYESIETAGNVIVRIELENGLVGWGNSAPDEHVTGESADSVERIIGRVFKPMLIGLDAASIESIWVRLCEVAPDRPAAIAAIDIALHDLLGKKTGLPLFRLLGHARDEIATSVTLSIDRTENNIRRAREFQAQGFKCLKIKCGLDAGADIDRVRAIRKSAGGEMKLTLDANQGYSVDETLLVTDALADCGIEFIEQPVAAGDLGALKEVCLRSPIPVMADESVLGSDDVIATPASLVNLKLMKMGGITGAIRACKAAEIRGIRAMIGCMDESRISMAAAAHLALALGNIAYADLDGHLDIIDDVASGGILIDDGMVSVSEEPGLGIRERETR